MNDKYFNELIEGFKQFTEVRALVLGGSRAINNNDQKSDYDLYVYVDRMPSQEKRKELLDKTCCYIELANTFWEEEDDCTLKNGIDIDIIYRDLKNIDSMLNNTLFLHQAQTGYTTCFWFNVLNSKVLFERSNEYSMLVKKYSIPYPLELRENIIKKNYALLGHFLPSYDAQIKKAIMRNDLNSVNHRVAAYLASYFDLLLAINNLAHPGEKRLKEYVLKHCKQIPNDFSSDLDNLFKYMFTEKVYEIIQKMNLEIAKLI